MKKTSISELNMDRALRRAGLIWIGENKLLLSEQGV